MIGLRSHPEGTILPVKAQPSARRSALGGVHNGILKVSVTATPDKGKANGAIVEVLCEHLSLARAQVELVAGTTSRNKQFLVRGVAVDDMARRIAAALAARGEKS